LKTDAKRQAVGRFLVAAQFSFQLWKAVRSGSGPAPLVGAKTQFAIVVQADSAFSPDTLNRNGIMMYRQECTHATSRPLFSHPSAYGRLARPAARRD
jgi:hypothetical protein